MNDYWLFWWGLVIASFAIGERYGFKHPERQNTLSRFMVDLGREWPMSIALLGALFGALLTHFYWPYCPFGTGIG